MYAVLHDKVGAEEVELVARDTSVACAEACCRHGFQAAHPEEDVDVVDVLLDDMVAREPFPVHPVAYVPLHVRPSCLTLTVPKHTLIPIDIAAGDVADESCLYLFVGFDVSTFVVTLCTYDNAQTLCLCLLGGCHYGTIALGIDSDRLLEERVDAFLGGVLEHPGAEDRRCGEDDHVNTGIDDFLIGIETEEASLVGDVLSPIVLQLVAQREEPVAEDIAKCHHSDAVGSIEQVVYCTAATGAAAYESYFQLLAIYGLVGEFRNVVFAFFLQRREFVAVARTAGKQGRSSHGCCTDSGSPGKEAATAHGFFFHSVVGYYYGSYGFFIVSIVSIVPIVTIVPIDYFSGSQTMRKPMPLMSLSHQMLFGFWGSVLSQAS